MASVTVQMGSAAAYPQPAPLTFVAMNSDPMPGYLTPITDSTWGTRIVRITNVDGRRNGYPTNQAWSKNGTWLYLAGRTTASLRRLLNGVTYEDIGSVSTTPQQIIWSNTDDNKGYGLHESLRNIYSWDPNTRTSVTQIATFSATGGSRRADQPADWIGIYAGGVWNISIDDHLVGFWADRGDGTWDAVAYDPVDDRIEAYLNVSTIPTAVVVSISGNYIIVDQSSISARKVYTMTARVGTTPGTFTHVRDISITNGSHGLPGVDHNGADIWIRCAGYGDVIRLDTGASTQLVPADTCVSGGHAGYAINRPGYVTWSVDHVASSGRLTEAGYGQLICTPTGAGTLPDVEVFGCHHNMVTTAAAASAGDALRLYAAPDRDGRRVLFGGDWHGEVAYSGSTYAFVAGLSV